MRALLFALPVLLMPLAAKADDALRVGDGVLPEARGWQAFDELAQLKADELEAKWPALMRAYRASPNSVVAEGCDVPEAARADGNEAGFRRADINADGKEDVIFSGASCLEGSATIFWLGQGDGYRLVTFGEGDAASPFSWFLLLRFEPGKDARLAILEAAAGDALLDHYRIVRLNNLAADGERTVSVAWNTPAPSGPLGEPKPFTQAPELSLLDKPEAGGDVIGVYGLGAAGRELARQTDAAGRMWRLVEVDAASQALMTQNPNEPELYGSLVGWVLQ